MDVYDVTIIGGGSAGLVLAVAGAKLGKKTALVEKHRIGGDCLWTGCVPSKALLKAAKVANYIKDAEKYGVAGTHTTPDWQRGDGVCEEHPTRHRGGTRQSGTIP